MPNKSDYQQQIDFINKIQTEVGDYECDFLTGKNLVNGNSYYSPVGVVALPEVSYYVYSNNPNFVTSWSTSDISANGGYITVEIDSTNLTVNYIGHAYGDLGFRIPSQPSWGPRYQCKGLTWDAEYNGYWVNQFMAVDPLPTFQSSFSTFNDIFDYLKTKFKHINIYVDGELWSSVEPVTYTWQSVPSISGKNGILSLVTLDSESINDGEPVSGAAVSVFDQVPSNDNNIKNLADTYGGGEASSAVDVTVKYKVTLPPGGVFDVLKLVAKKGSEPEDVTDGDKIVNISANKTKKTVTGLDENSMYYFKIFAEDSNGSTSESDEKHIATSGDEGWLFDYTGEIQTFVAPKTGIYQLETWGAQGGDASDGTRTARGGYGAYAVGEVFLTQGDTLYINVGGQNGYGGGGSGDWDTRALFYKNAVVFPPDGMILTSKGGGNYTIEQVKSKASSYDFIILMYDTNGYIAVPINLPVDGEMRLGSGEFVVDDGQTDWLYGIYNALGVWYPMYLNGTSLGVSWNFQGHAGGDDITYANEVYSSGSVEHPCYIVANSKITSIYIDGVKQ